MMTWLALAGLAALILILWRPLSVIPITFAAYFLAVTYIPTYLGYAVDESHLYGKEAYLLTSVGRDFILVVLEGETQPRLVKITPSEEADEASKRAKDGASIIRFGSEKDGYGGGESENGERSSVKIVQLKDSKMLKKE